MTDMSDKFDLNVVNHFFEKDYQDRGKQKWQGFFLSDHQVELTKQVRHDHRQDLPQQTIESICKGLNNAVLTHQKLLIQLKSVNKNGQHQSVEARVIKFNRQCILLESNLFLDTVNVMALKTL